MAQSIIIILWTVLFILLQLNDLMDLYILTESAKSIAVIGAGFLGSELATAMVVKGGYQIYSCDRNWFPRQ